MSLRRFALALCLSIVFSCRLQAQTFPWPVHHWQCQAYVADSTPVTPGVTCHFPANISAQGHWNDPTMPGFVLGDTSLLNPGTAHVAHVECLKPPVYAEVKTLFVILCQVVAFHLPGYVSFVGSSLQTTGIQWVATGTSTPPIMQGDPMGVRTWPFWYVIDPEGWRTINPHGWVSTRLMARTYLNNGAGADVSLVLPFWSMLDPNAPVMEGGEMFSATMRASIEPHSPRDPGGSWGTVLIETGDPMPILAPLTQPYTATSMRGYQYGATQGFSPPGVVLGRSDINLHAGSEGRAVTFGRYDPMELGQGGHRVAMIWKEDSGAGNMYFGNNETAVALLAVDVASAGGTTPPGPEPLPINCVLGPWFQVSTSTTSTVPVLIGGDHYEKAETTTTHFRRNILTQPSNSGTACVP